MINNRKIIVVLPAYNAEKTLEKTYQEIPFDIVDDVVLGDDASKDQTLEIARKIGISHIVEHSENKGYGANQKSCYKKAIELGADIIVLLHPDYQYTPGLIPSMTYLIANDLYKVVLGSRILGKGAFNYNGAVNRGMPFYKYLGNRFLTMLQNIVMRSKLSEYHTGYRAFSAELLKEISFEKNSDGFIFDNQLLAQILHKGYEIAEVTCPIHYFPDASSISFKDGMKYFYGVIGVTFRYLFDKAGVKKYKLFH
jgi:glycosyltransferase involved in cell wall biosynthesis